MQRGSVRDAVRSCRNARSPDLLLVDLDGEQDPVVHIAGLLQVCRPESVILATGSENNVTLANELYRGGVFLYLPKPLDAASLRRALQRADSGAIAAEQLQASASPRIGLVAHPVDQIDPSPSENSGLEAVVDPLSAQAHVVFASGVTAEEAVRLRPRTTDHLIVFEPTPAGVSVAARWLRILDGATSALVLNHARPLPDLIGEDQLRDALGGRLPDVRLPYVRGMARAMALGEPETAAATAGPAGARAFPGAAGARSGDQRRLVLAHREELAQRVPTVLLPCPLLQVFGTSRSISRFPAFNGNLSWTVKRRASSSSQFSAV